MSQRKSKLRLADLREVSSNNASARRACLVALSKLPLPCQGVTSAREMERVIDATYPPLKWEALSRGVAAIVADYHRQSEKPREPDRNAAYRKAAQRRSVSHYAREIVTSLEVGSRVVELFDSMSVNGVPLGDCNRAGLYAESLRITGLANRQLTTANLLARIADTLAPDEIVRKAAKRALILDMLKRAFPSS